MLPAISPHPMPKSPFNPEPVAYANLFEDIPAELPSEDFRKVCELGKGLVRVERIVSRGHRSPEDFWYDQEEDEWVLMLQGHAELEIEGRPEPVLLEPGDSLLLPAHCRHRVARTAEDEDTVWLAVFPTP